MAANGGYEWSSAAEVWSVDLLVEHVPRRHPCASYDRAVVHVAETAGVAMGCKTMSLVSRLARRMMSRRPS